MRVSLFYATLFTSLSLYLFHSLNLFLSLCWNWWTLCYRIQSSCDIAQIFNLHSFLFLKICFSKKTHHFNKSIKKNESNQHISNCNNLSPSFRLEYLRKKIKREILKKMLNKVNKNRLKFQKRVSTSHIVGCHYLKKEIVIGFKFVLHVGHMMMLLSTSSR